MAMKAISQPHAFAIKGMVSGASSAPICAPELKMLVAYALSFLGKYSAVALSGGGEVARLANGQHQSCKYEKGDTHGDYQRHIPYCGDCFTRPAEAHGPFTCSDAGR